MTIYRHMVIIYTEEDKKKMEELLDLLDYVFNLEDENEILEK